MMKKFFTYSLVICFSYLCSFSMSFAQNVGIGTNAPVQKLHVEGNTYINGKLSVGSNADSITSNTPTLNVKGSVLFKGGNPGFLDAPPRAGVEFFFGRTGAASQIPGTYQLADIAFNFGEAPGGYRHFISTRHQAQVNNITNAFDFYVNNSIDPLASQQPGVGNKLALSISATGLNVPNGYIAIGTSGEAGEKLYVNGTAKIESDLSVNGTLNMGYTTVTQDFLTPGSMSAAYTVSCPAGTRLTGGGGGYRDGVSGSQFINVNYNGPDASNPSVTWKIVVTNTNLLPLVVKAYCMCARIN